MNGSVTTSSGHFPSTFTQVVQQGFELTVISRREPEHQMQQQHRSISNDSLHIDTVESIWPLISDSDTQTDSIWPKVLSVPKIKTTQASVICHSSFLFVRMHYCSARKVKRSMWISVSISTTLYISGKKTNVYILLRYIYRPIESQTNLLLYFKMTNRIKHKLGILLFLMLLSLMGPHFLLHSPRRNELEKCRTKENMCRYIHAGKQQ